MFDPIREDVLAIVAALDEVLRLTGNNDSRKTGHG